jgi:hypothetical protein
MRAMTMAATSPTDSVWTRKSMRRFSLSLASYIRFGWLPNQGRGQLVVTLPLLVLSLRRPLILSSRRLVAVCITSPRAALSSSRRLVVPPLVLSRCASWLSHYHLSSSSRCTALLLSSHRARHNDGKGKQGNRRHDDGYGRHDDSKGRHGDGKRQQGDRRHDNGNGQHDNGKGQQGTSGGMTTTTGGTTTGVTSTARGSRATGGTTTATGSTTTARGSRAHEVA